VTGHALGPCHVEPLAVEVSEHLLGGHQHVGVLRAADTLGEVGAVVRDQ